MKRNPGKKGLDASTKDQLKQLPMHHPNESLYAPGPLAPLHEKNIETPSEHHRKENAYKQWMNGNNAYISPEYV